MLTPPPKQVGLQIDCDMDPEDLAKWQTTHPQGEVVELRPDGSGRVVALRLWTS